jgi:hypothetical protein
MGPRLLLVYLSIWLHSDVWKRVESALSIHCPLQLIEVTLTPRNAIEGLVGSHHTRGAPSDVPA